MEGLRKAIKRRLPIRSLQRRDQEGATEDAVENLDAGTSNLGVGTGYGPSYPPGYVKTDERRH